TVFGTFFLSSRRRHTRFSRDWSSDVCSSDLAGKVGIGELQGRLRFGQFGPRQRTVELDENGAGFHRLALAETDIGNATRNLGGRSEERRVGKEDRSRMSTCTYDAVAAT